MKKLIAILLTAALCLSLLPAAAFADNAAFIYNDAEIQDLYYDFEYVSDMVLTHFTNEKNLAYWSYAKQKEEENVGSWLINMSNKIIGEEPDEKYYTQLLTNMIALFEHDLAQQIEKQGQYDNMKNIKEYGLDLIDIGTTVIGMQGKMETLEKVISVLGDSVGLLVQTTSDVKHYELAIRNYANAETFLKAVCEYSDNQLLSDAAKELRTANELLFKERVNCISSAGSNLGTFTAKNFLGDFSFALLKNTDSYKNDSFIKDFVSYGETAYKALDKLISTFNSKMNANEELLEQAKAKGFSLEEIVVIASLIEKETDGSDHKNIASVIYNRLADDGAHGTYRMLNIDAALLYALPSGTTSLSNADKEMDSPYNLYKYAGLPPTAIANPGLASIQAALEPAQTDYYYYALGKDGRHHYSTTLGEHNNFLNSGNYGG